MTAPAAQSPDAAVDAVAAAIDRDLAAHDVRLTMGGEPTFVAADNADAPEWTTDALGPTKRTHADALVRRLRVRFAPGGLLHYGAGKWYPGEPLPRWCFAVYWRKDGVPIWRDAALIAAERTDHSPTAADAQAFAAALAARLGLDPARVLAAYEDPAYFLLREARLPDNVDPTDSRLIDARERDRLARVFARGLAAPVGAVLPLQRADDGAGWISEAWRLRRGYFFLAPGDGPLGSRLPIGALSYIPPGDYPFFPPLDPFAEHGSFPDRSPDGDDALRALAAGEAGRPVRTALAVEPRDGRLCIFMPPVARAEDYLVLVQAVEACAAARATPVHVEGYPPPDDPRLEAIRVTPDPGVIEVNLHPVASWAEAAAATRGVYGDAHAAGLRAQRPGRAGRSSCGTGGGSHIVFGGASAADSPFLRRPDLLKSILVYWQRHPSLSYLFAGQFVGPTSQSPRVDEARHEALYELEIALAQVPAPGAAPAPAPWLTDRLFRHLLTDLTGNTHRTEICIDKLFSPDGVMGRLGLVEFRAFEMAPSADLALTRLLLLRGLIAWLWRKPREGACVRWGSALHDHFMLEHFVWADFLSVLDDLAGAGTGLDPAWFEPQRALRFPVRGGMETGGVHIELRAALEPWNVLGEESVGAATARAVDSSLERLQVAATGLDPARHALVCNGRRVPLSDVGGGRAVAGIRFKARKLVNALHPTLGLHVPLRFVLVDAAAGRALGAFLYDGGGAGDGAREPVSPCPIEPSDTSVPPAQPNAEFPLTLDLRRPPPR